VYATNSNNGQPSTIAGYQLDTTTGVLTPIPGSPFATGGNGAVIASIDPTGKFLYTAHFSSNTIQGFAIDQTSGALTAVPGGPFTTGTNPFAANIDPSGKYLYSSSRGSNTVSSFAINQTSGALTVISTLNTGMSPGATELVGLQ
jgi:DNA-binding beta-propeller fold protein YncE